MGMAYSKDIRLRAAKAMIAGESSRQVAARFGVGASSVMRWRRLLVATEGVDHGKLGGHRKPVLAAHSDFILQSLETTPHLTLNLLAAMLEFVREKWNPVFPKRQTNTEKTRVCLVQIEPDRL
jgi:transposase